MRERLDCAVFSTACTHDWIGHWFDGRPDTGRLRLHALRLGIDTAQPKSNGLLAGESIALRRFDACLLTVSERNLAWARTTMLAARNRLQTPVIALAHQLKAAALTDLYGLGLADFVRGPICLEELRARVERVLDRHGRRATGQAPAAAVKETGLRYADRAQATEEALCANILERSGIELDAFAAATASRCATSHESFKSAKSRVVERFERAYITAALGRHYGNIAMAARAAQKHRRAFWALMRKHQIDAAPYRTEPPSGRPGPG